MSSSALELLDLIARWLHVVAGIMWVGNSLLFNWLDRTLAPPSRAGDGLLGESWLLHSGGFYFVEKTQLAGEPLPRSLHWFKWQAYTTWLSGAALLIVVYYLGGRAALADPGVAPLSHGAAVAVGIGYIVGGVAAYELVQRHLAPRAPRASTVLLLVAFVGGVYALTHLLNGRAAFLHVGAMLASIMAGNVAMTIIPSQRELVKSVQTGGRADPVVSARAKRVSIFNNYITFPVIALMLSGHVPSVYAHRWSWLLLLVIIAGGAGVRHVLNTRFATPSWKPRLAMVIVATSGTLYLLLAFVPAALPVAADRGEALGASVHVTFADARHVIDRRCAACHSSQPSDSTFGAAPAGVMFDLPAQIQSHAARIRERGVVTRTMPPANKTHITERERMILGRWIDEGASLRP
ncbi:MAG: urate hydroxylase PuuD [Gemmatimonadaceae bacterium]|nr:urate hydroxylase PuuD [Gemmatimonadaceae bacterium]